MAENRLKRILVVDDEAEALAHISNILKRSDYDVVVTTKGKEAIDLAINLCPDLIILDMVMPDMGGSGVSSILVRNPATSNIPIIFLTGILPKEEEEAIISRTARPYVIVKPATPEELLAAIKRILP